MKSVLLAIFTVGLMGSTAQAQTVDVYPATVKFTKTVSLALMQQLSIRAGGARAIGGNMFFCTKKSAIFSDGLSQCTIGDINQPTPIFNIDATAANEMLKALTGLKGEVVGSNKAQLFGNRVMHSAEATFSLLPTTAVLKCSILKICGLEVRSLDLTEIPVSLD